MLCCCWDPREYSRGCSFLDKQAAQIPVLSFVVDAIAKILDVVEARVEVWFNAPNHPSRHQPTHTRLLRRRARWPEAIVQSFRGMHARD